MAHAQAWIDLDIVQCVVIFELFERVNDSAIMGCFHDSDDKKELDVMNKY